MAVLYVVATPIGNLEDITLRAIKTLLSVEVIACEDTRHTGQLLKILSERYAPSLGIAPVNHRYISIRDWNEAETVGKVLQELTTNDVALVSDAGTPLISDPGFKLVRAARAAQIPVAVIPGPSAVTAALSVAGLPTDKFVFWGFLPKKWELLTNMTNVIYESPQRLEQTITKIKDRYPQAQLVLASELTKVHEQVQEITESVPNKGEHVILVSFSQSSPKESSDS